MFSQRLDNLGIPLEAEEYIVTHVSGIFARDGRMPTDLLPFFADLLIFQAGDGAQVPRPR